jgi:hypothetical protein
MRHDIDSCDQDDEDQDDVWLENDYENANTCAQGGDHLLVLAHLRRR